MTKMNGGLLLNDTHESKTIEQAIDFFKRNSTFSILTNSSVACITFKATLKDDIESPFIHIRSGIIEQPVRTLLFKYFTINFEFVAPTSEEKNVYRFYTYKPREELRYIHLSQAAEIQNEFNIQLKVYQATYNTLSSAYEPVCPYPIHCSTDLNKEKTIQEIIQQLRETDVEKKESNSLIITDTLGGDIIPFIKNAEDDSHITFCHIDTSGDINWDQDIEKGAAVRTKIKSLGCIVMEFMDGFTTLYNYITYIENISFKDKGDGGKFEQEFIKVFGQSELDTYKKNLETMSHLKAYQISYDKVYQKTKSLAAYELVRLKQIGFIHGDLHQNNIMYNPNYKYITNKDEDIEHKGRALIIDFGFSLINKEKLAEKEQFFSTHDVHDVDNRKNRPYQKLIDVYEEKYYEQRFYPPSYTFAEIYRRRLEVTLEFRKTMIQGLEKFLTTSQLSTKKAKLKLDLIRNLKWPTNFVSPNEGDFENEEFDTPFKEVKDPLIEEFKKENTTLSEERIEEITKTITELEGKAKKALVDLTYLTNTLKATFLTPLAHGGGRYINFLKKQNAFANRRNRTTLKGKRRQTKRSKKRKREKLTKRKKMNN